MSLECFPQTIMKDVKESLLDTATRVIFFIIYLFMGWGAGEACNRGGGFNGMGGEAGKESSRISLGLSHELVLKYQMHLMVRGRYECISKRGQRI